MNPAVHAAANYELANLLAMSGRPAEAVPHYEAALKARPGLRNGLFAAVVGAGLVHGYSLILGSGAQPDLRESAGAEPLAAVRVARTTRAAPEASPK